MNDHARPVERQATADLLARYDRPGPRYTSYPTAVEFHEGFTAADYEGRLAAADPLGEVPLSVYVHLPFCEERCLFCGCHVIISPHKERARPYLDLLRREVELVADRLPHRRKVAQLHLGGGTPTYHAPADMAALLEHMLARFTPLPGAELAVEVDPRVTSDEHIDVLAGLGFNRISLGVQDFTPEVQQAVNRVQSIDETRRVVERARARGYTGTNIDLIYGLPLQSPASFERTVEEVIAIGADRCAVYSFAFVPWIRGNQRKIVEEQLPPRDTKFELFSIARERFLAAGYEPIGMDHFAKPDDELARAKREHRLRRNFQGYTVIPGDDVLGFGISAIGDVRGAYVQNVKKLSRYRETVEAGQLPVERGVARTADDDLRREVIHELMCNFRVDIAEVERSHAIIFREYFAEDLRRLSEHEREGLVRVTDRTIEATPAGELFVRNLAMCFDRYWREKHEGSDKPIFSRTV
ncbi:MAG: oxygen-independent coproporphyrinogen III oxidase [Acidobacteria bacterium]|nr:oxygen-independent coproporphyrinogen III oxidase [Acidobacteriota bacterium]